MKRSGIQRKRRSPRSRKLQQLQGRFHRAVTAATCVMCADEVIDPEVKKTRAADIARREAHHVLPKHKLMREKGVDETDPLVWDPDNGVCLCHYHHWRHEHYVQRLPRRLVPAKALMFATWQGLGWLFDREYPRQEADADAA